MAISIVMSNELNQDAGVKILVYGEAGMGKTVLAASLPRPILISAEAGTLSLSPANIERIYGQSNLPFTTNLPTIVVKSLQDLEEAYQVCTHPDYQGNFDSIAIDSLSEIAEKCLAHFKPLNKDPRKAYGEMQDAMMDVVRKFRDIPNKNVYMSAKLGKDKDEVSGMSLYGPSMPGTKLGPQLPYLFDEVFRYQVLLNGEQGKTRVLQTQPGISDTAKDRSGNLDEYEFPHLGYVINKIKGIK